VCGLVEPGANMIIAEDENDLRGTRILLTGGTGSFGKEFVRVVLERFPGVERLAVYSRDELKQYEMAQEFGEDRYPAMRYLIGDVRDRQRLMRAMEGVDIVVHAAALKHVPVCEYNPFEAIKTNVLGAQNVIDCAMDSGVTRVVALSTDKASAPINLYGATKLCSDKLFVAANNYRGSRDIRFSVVRYGNVMGSRGSVIPFFLDRRTSGVLPVTDRRMTRFNITLHEGVELVLQALATMRGGELFVPKIPSYRITDVVEAVAPGATILDVGIRPGEKLHEDLITTSDALATVELPDRFVILPALAGFDPETYAAEAGAVPVAEGFRYNSGTNSHWLTVEEIRALIRDHLDPEFEPWG
jgi:UDP-N-acetylglucosamine 4,6-dehydratase